MVLPATQCSHSGGRTSSRHTDTQIWPARIPWRARAGWSDRHLKPLFAHMRGCDAAWALINAAGACAVRRWLAQQSVTRGCSIWLRYVTYIRHTHASVGVTFEYAPMTCASKLCQKCVNMSPKSKEHTHRAFQTRHQNVSIKICSN